MGSARLVRAGTCAVRHGAGLCAGNALVDAPDLPVPTCGVVALGGECVVVCRHVALAGEIPALRTGVVYRGGRGGRCIVCLLVRAWRGGGKRRGVCLDRGIFVAGGERDDTLPGQKDSFMLFSRGCCCRCAWDFSRHRRPGCCTWCAWRAGTDWPGLAWRAGD